MPWWKYFSNRFLTFIEETSRSVRTWVISTAASGSIAVVCWKRFRSSATRTTLSSTRSSWRGPGPFGFRLGDLPVPVRYFDEASSINFKRSTVYGLRTLTTMASFWLHRMWLWRSSLFRGK